MHETLFARIDAADADLADHPRVNGRHRAADLDQRLRTKAAQARHRHAVQVAARRQRAGVEVGVGVEPQHAQLLARLATVARHRADRADAQAVVAAKQDRQPALPQLGQHGVVHGLVPGHHLGQVPVAIDRRQPRIGRSAQVASVEHLQAVAAQHADDVGDPQRLRSHAGAATARTDVGGGSYQADESAHGCSVGKGIGAQDADWRGRQMLVRCRPRIRQCWLPAARSRIRRRAPPRLARRSRRSETGSGRSARSCRSR